MFGLKRPRLGLGRFCDLGDPCVGLEDHCVSLIPVFVSMGGPYVVLRGPFTDFGALVDLKGPVFGLREYFET